MGKIVVIGSVNIDIVTFTDIRPNVGETVLGETYKLLPGGKGANQAVAAAKITKDVDMMCAIGDDGFSNLVLENFEKNGIKTDYVEVYKGSNTGMANIIVSKGDNNIIVIPGANFEITVETIDKYIDVIKSAEICLLQLEIPLDVVQYIIDVCDKENVKTILNPAPARKLSKSTIEKVTYLTPNETEFKFLFNESEEEILRKMPNKLIITKGDKGVVYFDGENIINQPTIKTHPVDTTGAGDTFNGIFAGLIANKYEIKEAIELATLGATMSVERVGAQSGMPTIDELLRRKS